MKKFKRVYLTVLFSLLMAFGGVMFGTSPHQNIAQAQNTILPANAIFKLNTKIDNGNGDITYLPIPNATNILHQDAVFLKPNQVAIFEIGNPENFPQDMIETIVVNLYLNSESIDSFGVVKDVDGLINQWAQIVFDPYEAQNPDGEGKYQIELEYFDKNVVKQTLSYTFYLYKESTYFSSGLPAVSVQNVNLTTPGMQSASFARTHEFHYTNDYTSAQALVLPTISFDPSKFEISVSKNHSGITQSTYISVDESGNVQQTLPIVMVKKDDNDVVITFNDIGSYNVSYFMLYKSQTEKFLFANINQQLKPDRMQMFGFQAYHSNINATQSTDQQREFKVITPQHTVDENYQTDITYTQINSRFLNNFKDNLPQGSPVLYQNISGNNFILNNIDSRVIFNGNNISAKSTNQAPVSFRYNATLTAMLEESSAAARQRNSVYFKLTNEKTTIDNKEYNVWQRNLYDGRAFSDVGTYLVKLTYTSDLSTSPALERTQWFYFTISNQIPNHSVKANGADLSTGSFTKEVVEVSFNQTYNPFDSGSRLAVYRKDTLSGSSTLVSEVGYSQSQTFAQNGIYTVELSRGRNFQSKNTSEFIIDTTPITGLIARDVKTVSNALVKGSASGFFTNQAVAVEWNNKTTNNNTVSGFYKYIPLSQIPNISASEYVNYYSQGQFIPVPYQLNYQEGNQLSTIPYQNTINTNSLTNANVFTQEGLYMVRAVDKAGNEAFAYFFIDKTTPTILQKDALGNFLNDYSKLNIVSETVVIQWGNYKVIKTLLNLEDMNFDTWLKPGQTEADATSLIDPWLYRMLKQKANNTQLYSQDGDFKLATTGGSRALHFAPKINADNVAVAIGNNAFANLSNIQHEGLVRVGNHSVEVYSTKTVGGVLEGIENSYTFQINDESNKNTSPSTLYSITTSTDVSRTSVRFSQEESDFAYDTLTQHNYRVVNNDDSVLQTYFMPINTNILQLQFLTTTDETSIEIETLMVYYYPYITNYFIYTGNTSGFLVKNNYYTQKELSDNGITNLSQFVEGRSMVIAKEPEVITVFNYNTSTNLARLEGESLWVWDINIEEVYISNISHERTKAGKYQVVRTYKNNSELSNSLQNKADFMVRELTFILEREDVISSGIDRVVAGQNSTFSLVGGAAYIEILAGDPNSQKFTSLYSARSYSAEQQYVLIETNKLPVKLGFPIAKFGQVIGNNFALHANNIFYTDHKDSYINTFEMGIRITHLPTSNVVSSNLSVSVSQTQPPAGSTYILLENGLYLVLENVSNGYLVLPQNFTLEGKYQVDFFQRNTAIKGKTSSMSLFFQITHIAPNFDVVNEYGLMLPKHETEDIFYANQNQITIRWTDSSNPYYAKINQSEITYTINNGLPIKPSKINTAEDGITHSFNVPTTLEGAQIVVRMQYEGKAQDYAPGPFSKTKTIIVDKTAPTTSINNLIARMGDTSLFTAQSLRQGHNQAVRYNRTITEGNLAEFAFPVDMSNLESLILSNLQNDVSRLFYRQANNKYTDPSFKEFDPTQHDALLQLETDIPPYHPSSAYFEANSYYEFFEVDKAGNITVFTIYLTDIAQDVAFEQQMKNDDINYKDTLGDDFKLITYTSHKDNDPQTNNLVRFETILSSHQANHNLKVYAKQFFNLNSITPYGYKWSLLTFGPNKYLSSPNLPNGQVYRVQSGIWPVVNLENEIYLTISRSNYVFDIKNLPTANIKLNVVVSSNQLALQAPQATNPTLTITAIAANDSEYVRWDTVSIWEYIHGDYSAYALFTPSQQEPVERDPELDGFNLATYFNTGLSTVFNIQVKSQAYYRIKIVDNFGLEYVMYYLSGTQFVEQVQELEGRALVSDNTIDDTSYLISNAGFKYTYYPALTQSVEIEIAVFNPTTKVYEWFAQPIVLDANNETITDTTYVSVSGTGSYKTITLKINTSEFSSKFVGSAVIYKITSKTLASTSAENPEYQIESTNFKIYSITPKTILTGKNRQDLSDILLGNEGLVSEPITIDFETTQGFDYPVEVYLSYNNQTPVKLQSGQTFAQAGTYQITKVFSGAMGVYTISTESFVISDQESVYFSVVQYDEVLGKYVDVALAPTPYKLELPIGLPQTSITQHYIVNTTDWKINLSASQFMKEVPNEGIFASYDEARKNGVSTFVRTLSNHNAESENPDNKSFNYHKATIAVSYIPKQNKILKDFYYLDNQANRIALTNSEKVYPLIKDVDMSNKVEVYWNNSHLIQENKITANIFFGQDKQELDSSIIKTRGTTDYVVLTRSGNYSFMFTDVAGNVHKFDYNAQITESSSAYEFVFLNSVIFTVNNEAPIQYAIFNDDVKITLPSYTMSYYDNNARPTIVVMRDLQVITDYTYDRNTRTYTFEKPGLYQVLFEAKIGTKELKQEPYFFEIIREKEIAWVFNVEKYGDYYIETILKNDVDITNNLSNSSLGELISIKNGANTISRLKNIVISLYDEQTGAGNWKITINTNNDLKQTFTFGFTISDTNPPLVISHPEGSSTTDIITVSFNARNVYENVGEAVVKIGNTEILLNDLYFEGTFVETHNINITAIGDTYVQIFTPSGRLVYSYRVSRTVPLNNVAIIVIIASSLAVAGLFVMFILLRKRMKIR